jgi:serine protease AprX
MSEASSSSSSSSSSTSWIDYFRETAYSNAAISGGWDGTGIGVALIDSGITPNKDFKKGISYARSFVTGDTSTADAYGHGTHVAGIIVGSGHNSSSNSKYQFGGAAPGISLLNLRVLDANGNGTDSGVINAIQAAIAL